MKMGIEIGFKRIGSALISRFTTLQTLQNKYLGTIIRVKASKKVAAITFDDGPDQVWTPKILDVLDEFNVKATFFVIGKRVIKHPEIVKKAYHSGHTIANHTWDHPCLSLLPRKQRIEQIKKCKNAISGFDSFLFRPPYGCQSLLSKFDAYLMGYTVVAWDMHATDWNERQADEIAHDLNSKLRPGTIILLHDAQDGKSRKEMIRGLISFLKRNSDYQFVTVPELLKYGEKKEIIWTKKPNAADLKSHHERFDTIDI